mmetsp:Transcript_46694/g.74358  ORF Transcript_46694/g.74358 Transcript_46694/m.74358 type:complete len:233 (-) Transcript_46694:478-1176(-)
MSRTKLRSSLKARLAPCIAAPLPAFAASSKKALSLRKASGAPVIAPPCAPRAFKRKFLSLRSSGAASAKAVPEYLVASRTSDSSDFNSGDANFKAWPWLVSTALFTKSLSLFTCSGALASNFQSSRTAARHMACLQLLRVTSCASPESSKALPDLYSAALTPLLITEEAANCDKSASGILKAAAYSRRNSASSAAGKSLAILNSFLNLSAVLLFVSTAALALSRNHKPGMSR